MQTQSVDVDLTGSGFQSGADTGAQRDGSDRDRRGIRFTHSYEGQDECCFDAPHQVDVSLTVTNPDGKSATLSGAFTVMSASALMLIEITRADVNMGAGNGGLLTASSSNGNDEQTATTRAC